MIIKVDHIFLGIQRILRTARKRQGVAEGLLGQRGTALVAVTGFSTAALFRNEISEIIEEFIFQG